ncbi:fatty-acid oxidation protein subunit alpha [Candidatus Magnetomorum sp. HK-1]|nr:fatty-acid oxidation protein subunit alpha [Candidatus Magnetomorum sp. HK-1]
MAAKDLFHDSVRNGLQKEGWVITHDPLSVVVSGVQMAIDLGAEKLIAAEKLGEKIAVEIKSFVTPSAIYEFHTALGQYLNYQRALSKKEPERVLYLAVPTETYNSFFNLPFIYETISEYDIKLIIYDAEEEVIEKWIN